ncbi:hypothetical protein ACJU26_05390 [Acidithiobacillus sp. M4-SHS-6]|uniref:hypothetical protein n=1 Tax=Acidithiobacillus sp. M4-SHS-6 TaxID=3383024 RepID=UPI0039BEC643
MCDVVILDGVRCEIQGDLMDVLGTADLMPDVSCGYSQRDIQQHLCLCCVDIPATLAKHGYSGIWKIEGCFDE